MLQKTGLYRHYDAEDNLLYVGISLWPTQRLRRHQKAAAKWAQYAVTMTTEWFESREKALDAEATAIQTERPLHNIVHNKKKPFDVRDTIAMVYENTYGQTILLTSEGAKILNAQDIENMRTSEGMVIQRKNSKELK